MHIIFFIVNFLILAILGFLFVFLFSVLQSYFLAALFVPTPKKIARKMLILAELKEGERLYDLGCGVGTLPVLAAREFKARAIGVERVPLFYFLSKWRVKILGLNKKVHSHTKTSVSGVGVKIIRGDLFSQNLSKADVITLYLSTKANAKLKEKFKRELRPGSRIVSRAFKIPGWPEKAIDKKDKLYLYEVA